MLVNNMEYVKAIVDPGSQVIAMSEAVYHLLALSYDPRIRLNMQSANGNIDQSLGLMHNIPVQLGEITVYLQLHVISSPAYDILLGRSFDVLIELVVRNFHNENQTITICNLNSGQLATIPTMLRGQPQYSMPQPLPPVRRPPTHEYSECVLTSQ